MAAEETNKMKSNDNSTVEKSVVLYLHDLVYLLAVIMVIFVLFFRLVIVSGSSMYSTLRDGDWLLVCGRVFYQEPRAGDIIVASKGSFNFGEPIIKRVIATEGQTVDIDFEAGVVYVDGDALEEAYTFTPTNIQEGIIFPIQIAEDCIFVMGDNRNNSRDSRDPSIGMIDKRELLGRAIFLLFPGTGEKGNIGPREFDRIGAIK